MKVSLDTNIFLAVKNKEPVFEYNKRIIDSIESKQLEGALSSIVLAEVLVGFYQNKETDKAHRFSSRSIFNHDILEVTLEIAQESAKIRAEHDIKLPDAIIAASTIEAEADYLISQNQTLLKRLKIKKIAPKEFVDNQLESAENDED